MEIDKRKLGLQLVLLVLLVVLTLMIAPTFVAPLVNRWSKQRIAEWERLQDDGYALMKAGKYNDSEVSFRAALNYAEKLRVLSSREGSSAFGLGGALLLQKKFDEARVCFQRSLEIRQEVDGESSPEQCPALKRLVEVCVAMNDLDGALEYAKREVDICEAHSNRRASKLLSASRDLARVYEKKKDYTAALQVHEHIAKRMEAEYQSSSHELGIAYYREGLMYNVLKQYGRAEILYQKSFSMLQGSLEPEEAEWFGLLVSSYANLMDVTGRPNDAARLRKNEELPIDQYPGK